MWRSLLLPATSMCQYPESVSHPFCSISCAVKLGQAPLQIRISKLDGVRHGNEARAGKTRAAAPVTASTWRHMVTPNACGEELPNSNISERPQNWEFCLTYLTTGLREYYIADHLILWSTTDRATNQPISWRRTLAYCANRRPCLR